MDFSNKIPRALSTSAQMFSLSAEYRQTVERCWDKNYYNEQKKLMKQFLVLQSQGLQCHVPHHTTVEDMSNWLVKNKSLERFRKEAEEGNDISHLTWEVNTQLRMRDVEHEAFTELATDLSQAINSLDFTADLSYLNPEGCDEVVRALKSISQSLAFQPYSELCCPSKVVVDIVSRLLQALWSCQMESPCDRSSMALSDMSVTIVLAVVENLSRVLKAPPVAQVYYSRSTGVRMVHSLNRKIQCLSSPEDLRRALFTQSSTLISTIIAAVSTKVQRLFEAPADYIPLSSIRSWLSEPKASEVCPKCPDQLVISSELLRNIIGMIVYVVFEGHLEEDINLHYWPLINDIIHQLSLCGVKVTKKGGKANWHIGWYQILEMVTNIHTHLHHYTGTGLVLKFATSARATMLTRHMVHHVVEELVKLKDVDEGTPASGSSESVTAPLITNPVKVDNITTTMTTTPVDLQSGFAPAPCISPPGIAIASCKRPLGFALASCPPTPGFPLASCPPMPGFTPASCPPPPGFAPLSCPPPPGFALLSCPPPGFALLSCPLPPGFAPLSCPPTPGFAPLSCPPPTGFAPLSCPPPPAFALLCCPPPPGFAPSSCPPPPGFAPLSCPPPPGFAASSCPPPPGFSPTSCPPPPGFAPTSCPPPPGFAPLSCPPPPGFAQASCPPPPGFAQASCPPRSVFNTASCPPPPGFPPASCHPPPGFPPASCHPPLTIADHICTLIQSITARSNNIVNKELEKCIDSYSKSIWADTFYCEYMKMYPSPQGIEAFSFDEERFLVVTNIIGRILLNNLQLEMLLSVEDFNVDEVGSSGSVDLNLAIPETPNPDKVVDITTPLTTNPVNLEVLNETLVHQSGFAPAPCIPPPGFSPGPCIPPSGFALTSCTASPSSATNAKPGFGTKIILKQMVLLFLERLPPASDDLESEFLTIADRICTLFQSITDRFRNIVNEELEKCTDSDSKQYWAYTFYWESMKRYLSSQCLGIEAFTCDEERCLMVANLFAKKLYPKMFLSEADIDEAEDSGSNRPVDMNLAINIKFVPNPVKVLEMLQPLSLPDIKKPLTTIHDKVLDNTATTLVDAPVKVDNITTTLVDAPVKVDNITTPLVDAPVKVDNITTPLVDAPVKVDNITTPLVDAPVKVDNITTPLVDNPVKVDNITSPLVDAPVKVDNITTPMVDAPFKVDNITTPLVDAPVKVDNITTPLVDAPFRVDNITTPLATNPVHLKVTDEPVEFLSEDVVVIKPKKRRVMRFFRRLFCCINEDDLMV